MGHHRRPTPSKPVFQNTPSILRPANKHAFKRIVRQLRSRVACHMSIEVENWYVDGKEHGVAGCCWWKAGQVKTRKIGRKGLEDSRLSWQSFLWVGSTIRVDCQDYEQAGDGGKRRDFELYCRGLICIIGGPLTMRLLMHDVPTRWSLVRYRKVHFTN